MPADFRTPAKRTTSCLLQGERYLYKCLRSIKKTLFKYIGRVAFSSSLLLQLELTLCRLDLRSYCNSNNTTLVIKRRNLLRSVACCIFPRKNCVPACYRLSLLSLAALI